jgi:hypothetical protein
MKYWEVIADKLSAAGFTWGYCSAVTHNGWRWVVDAHCRGGRLYVVESDDLLNAFLELESALFTSIENSCPTLPIGAQGMNLVDKIGANLPHLNTGMQPMHPPANEANA